MKADSCCFTGHRPQALPWKFNESSAYCSVLKYKIKLEIERSINFGYKHFISGMAIGVDLYAAEQVLDLKERYPHITLEAAIPCVSQPSKWNEESRKKYFSILEQCDMQTLVSKEYTPYCMMKRNMYMVDNSSRIIAVWNGSSGGTANTVEYAKKSGITIVYLEP